MKIRLVTLTFVGLAMVALTGCAKVSEPWDSRDVYEQERTRSAEQQQALRQRLAHTQNVLVSGVAHAEE